MGSPRQRIRLTALIITPLLFCILATTLVARLGLSAYDNRQQTLFGHAITRQLSQLSEDFVLGQDILALNVLLDTQLSQLPLAYAAVYDADGRLLAQSGSRPPGSDLTRADITRNNEVLGHLTVVLASGTTSGTTGTMLAIAVSQLLLLLGVIAGTWRYFDALDGWLQGLSRAPREAPMTTMAAAKAADVPPPVSEVTTAPDLDELSVLSLKARPGRLLPVDAMRAASQLYQGELEVVHDEELLVVFRTLHHCESAANCAAVMRELLGQEERLRYQIAVDTGSVTDEAGVQKRTRYLASMADDTLLLSHALVGGCGAQAMQRLHVVPYISPMSGEGDVYQSENCDALLKQQAASLA